MFLRGKFVHARPTSHMQSSKRVAKPTASAGNTLRLGLLACPPGMTEATSFHEADCGVLVRAWGGCRDPTRLLPIGSVQNLQIKRTSRWHTKFASSQSTEQGHDENTPATKGCSLSLLMSVPDLFSSPKNIPRKISWICLTHRLLQAIFCFLARRAGQRPK